MREHHTVIHRLFIVIASGLFASITTALAAESDNEKFLPPKAKSVAEKFAAFQESADPAAIEEKRSQVVEYLGALLKKEAEAAKLDEALAVKALIDRLEEEANSGEATSAGIPEGRPLETFAIDQESHRRLEFPFLVARDSATKSLRCEITGASDDSGDRGLEYRLIDPRGRVVKQGILTASGPVVVSHRTRTGGEWKLVLEDTDTEFGGEFPGNHGSLRITVARGEAALASNRRSR